MNFWIYALTMLASVGFYNYHGMVTIVMQRAMFYALTIVALTMALTERNEPLRSADYPRVSYWALIILISLSALMANIFHHQPLGTCIIATIPYIFAYLWFYILMRMKLSPNKILKFLFINVCIGSVVYFINVATFPNNVFGEPILEDLSRGIQRIPIQFGEFLPLFIYYGIYKYKISNKKKYILLIAMCSIMILASVVRQTIVFTAVLGLWYFLKDAGTKRKMIICGIAVVFALVVVPRIPFYNDIMELTEKQLNESNENEEDIRIQAWRFYTYESWDNPATTLFGNGIPSIGKSKYGDRFEANADATKCFAEDVGYAGFSYYFGIITTLVLLVFLIKSCMRHNPHKQYLSVFLFQTIVSSAISAPILYFYCIIGITTILYLIYANDEQDSEIQSLEISSASFT